MRLIYGSLFIDPWGYAYGGDGADFIVGGSENEAILTGGGNDLLVGGAGDDLLDGGDGDDRLVGGPGNDTLRGGVGRDTLDYSGLGVAVDVNLRFRSAHGDGFDRVSGFEDVIGTPFNDILRGDARDNRLTGGAGDDLLEGGEGRDTVVYYDAPRAVTVDLAAYLALGHGRDGLVDVESVVGSHFSDTLRGNEGENWLTGREGDDLLDGGEGADVASFAYAAGGVTVVLEDAATPGRGWATGEGQDTLLSIEGVVGSAHSDLLTGGRGADWLSGGGGADRLQGGDGDDRLEGGEGDDQLAGGAGHDRLVGGSGADRFVDAPGGGLDEIRDFVPGADRVDLTAWDFATAVDVLARLADRPGGCVLDLGDGDGLTFVGLTAAAVGAPDFILG